MNMSDTSRIDIVTVELARPLLRENYGTLLATGDEYANRFGAIIVRNGEAVDIANFLVSGSFIRPDGVTLTLEGVSEGNTVYVDLPSDCYKYDGVFTLSIKIVKGDVTETVRMVDGYIRRTETGNYVADEETIITLDKIQGMANEMAQLYEQAKETMEELSGATENLENALEEAETLPEKLPYIGDNGNWMQWDDDAGKFIDSGSPSRGIPGVNGTTPVKGKDYFDGEPGYTPQKGIDYFDGTSVTITNVSQSTADGGTNVVTFSDGKTLSIKNGSKGSPGADGKMTFEDLTEEQKESLRGPQGIQGPAGVDGRTPVAGVDYYTAADKAELVEEVKSQIGEVDGDYAPAIHADQHSCNDTLTWDGDTTGRVSAHYAIGADYYLVSDKVPTVDDIANGYMVKARDNVIGEEIYFEGSFSRIEEWGCLCSDGGIYDYTMAIVPTDNYTIEMYDITFPKKGIYFLKYVSDFDGEDQIVTSLTIPGYAFDEGTDPITPEMISAAPHNHASKYGEYGMGTAEKYGHLKIADVGEVFTGGEENLLDLAIELPNDDPSIDLKPYAFGAFTGYTVSNLIWAYVSDTDGMVMILDEIVNNLRLEVIKLRNEVDALKGGS